MAEEDAAVEIHQGIMAAQVIAAHFIKSVADIIGLLRTDEISAQRPYAMLMECRQRGWLETAPVHNRRRTVALRSSKAVDLFFDQGQIGNDFVGLGKLIGAIREFIDGVPGEAQPVTLRLELTFPAVRHLRQIEVIFRS